MIKGCKDAMRAHGGPVQYLEHRYSTPDQLQAYAAKLWKLFPASKSPGPVQLSYPVPHVAATATECPTLIFHIASLSFRASGTDRELPHLEVANLLVDEFCTDGFVATEPLKIDAAEERLQRDGVPAPWTSENAAHNILAFGVGFEKGVARNATLHVMLTLIMDDDVDLQKVLPTLYASVFNIKCAYQLHPDTESRIFAAFKASSRGQHSEGSERHQLGGGAQKAAVVHSRVRSNADRGRGATVESHGVEARADHRCQGPSNQELPRAHV